MLVGIRCDQSQGFVHGRAYRDRLRAQIKLIGFDTRDVQQLGDQPEQVPAGTQNVPQMPSMTRLGQIHFQHLRIAQDRIERSPQFMAAAREKFGFCAVGGFGLAPRQLRFGCACGQQFAGLRQALPDLAQFVAGTRLRCQRQAFAQPVGVGGQGAQAPGQCRGEPCHGKYRAQPAQHRRAQGDDEVALAQPLRLGGTHLQLRGFVIAQFAQLRTQDVEFVLAIPQLPNLFFAAQIRCQQSAPTLHFFRKKWLDARKALRLAGVGNTLRKTVGHALQPRLGIAIRGQKFIAPHQPIAAHAGRGFG